jgi:hypothetical protein
MSGDDDDDDEEDDLFGFADRGARRSDPETSWQAAYRDLRRRAGDRILALEVHIAHPRGLTDFELGDLMGRQQTSAGKRRGELRDLGLIEATALRRLAPSGSPAIVWLITNQGRRVHLELHRRWV